MPQSTPPLASSAIVLFAHGARDPLWAEPLQQLRDAVQARHSGPVALAFLELMTPTLDQVLTELHQSRVSHVRIIPAFMARGAHLRRDLPALVLDLKTKYPELIIHVSEALGEAAGVQNAMAEWIVAQADWMPDTAPHSQENPA